MDIFKNAAGILFIDQIGDFVGIFYRMWIKDNVRGFRHLTAETYYRNEMEFQAKFVALTNISITVYYTYMHWAKDPNQVIISYHWYLEMAKSGISGLFIAMFVSFLIVYFGLFDFSGQGFNIDPDL